MLENRINNKSKVGSSQEKHHSGPTDSNIPDIAASTEEAPKHEEMWSIFSEYPETISQCVGRKLKILRLESARIDLHDNVELEVKATIEEEEKASQDILVVNDEIEDAIRNDVENEAKEVNREGRRTKRGRRKNDPRMKSTVSRPDIRAWLNKQAETKPKEEKNDDRREICVKMKPVTAYCKVGACGPDLRHWLISNAGTKEACKSTLPEIDEIPEDDTIVPAAKECSQELIVISDEDTAESKEACKTNLLKIIESTKGDSEIQAIVVSDDEHSSEMKMDGPRPDIRQWLKSKPSKRGRKTILADPEKEKENAYVAMLDSLREGPPDDILCSHFLQIKRRDFRSLAGKNYLNDKIIDQYLQLIRQRNFCRDMMKIYPLTTHAYTWLEENYDGNFPTVSRWCIKDITDMNLILVPIHKADHWSLVVVDLGKEVLSYYDSIKGNQKRSNAPKVIKKFIEHLWRMKGKSIKLKVKIMENAPLQGNGYDCGVFVCQNSEKIARGVFVSTKQADMSNARRRMMKEIFYGTLLEDIQEFQQIVTVEQKKVTKKAVTKKKTEPISLEGSVSNGGSRKTKLKWPRANSSEWSKLDEDLTKLLEILYSPPEKLAESQPKIIYEMCKERFGVIDKSTTHKKQPPGPSKRQRKCKRLRDEINQLKQAYKEAPDEEKEGINELQSEKLKKLRLAKRAESLKQSRKKFTVNCKEFLGQPYQFARNLLAPKPSGELRSTKEEVEKYLKDAHSDPDQFNERDDHDELLHYEHKDIDFNDSPPTYKEFSRKLRKTRSKSAPGPNGVPYLVYKRCPGVAKLLCNYLRLLWRRNKISNAWREAEGIFIPKEDGASTVDKFRTISLLNVEGKLFFSMKADRITGFLTDSGYIDPAIQKGGIPGVSGCLEHTSILSQLIREAKAEKKNLVVTWLDIANAYGSIPHDVIMKALRRAHVPENTRQLIESYYIDVKIRFTTKEFTTSWQRLEKGIITGCTLGVILFALTMSWLVESNKKVTKGPKTPSGQRQANSRLFMDDIASTTETGGGRGGGN